MGSCVVGIDVTGLLVVGVGVFGAGFPGISELQIIVTEEITI